MISQASQIISDDFSSRSAATTKSAVSIQRRRGNTWSDSNWRRQLLSSLGGVAFDRMALADGNGRPNRW